MSAVGWRVSLVSLVTRVFRLAHARKNRGSAAVAVSLAALVGISAAMIGRSVQADPPVRFAQRHSLPYVGDPNYGGGPGYVGGPNYGGGINYGGGPGVGGPGFGFNVRPLPAYQPPVETHRHHSPSLLSAAQRLNAAICNYAHAASRSPVLPAADRNWAELAERKSHRFVEGLQCRAAWGRVSGDWVALREHLKLCDRSLERLCARGRGDYQVERAFDVVRRDWGYVEQLVERCR